MELLLQPLVGRDRAKQLYLTDQILCNKPQIGFCAKPKSLAVKAAKAVYTYKVIAHLEVSQSLENVQYFLVK